MREGVGGRGVGGGGRGYVCFFFLVSVVLATGGSDGQSVGGSGRRVLRWTIGSERERTRQTRHIDRERERKRLRDASCKQAGFPKTDHAVEKNPLMPSPNIE